MIRNKPEIDDKDKPIDFKQSIINERSENVMTIQPTYGVTFDKINVSNNKSKNVTNCFK